MRGRDTIMSNHFIGLLLIFAGLITPMHKETMSALDWTVMVLFLCSGVLILLFSSRKRSEEDETYRCQLLLEDIKLFDEEGKPALTIGQQLFVQPYAGPTKENVHILTEAGNFVAKMPQEHCRHVLYKIERHSPVHLVIKTLDLDDSQESYRLSIEMMC